MVKIGVIGLGPIGSMHVDNLIAGKIPGAKLECICEQRPVTDAKYAGIKVYRDVDDMLKNADIDAAIVSTPSFTHFQLGKKVLESGRHVLVEKPVALCTADADELVKTAESAGKLCAVMLNQRTTPLYVRIRELVRGGGLGKINRVSWVMSNWYRPDIYFTSSPWRGTWKGEAGGALINQSIHNIDIIAWVFGLPESLRAWCKYGKYHNIEVEDEVSCVMQFGGDMSATFITSTGEHPGENRFVIAGDKGFAVASGGRLNLTRFKEGSLSEYTANTKYVFGCPETEESVEEFDGIGPQHVGVVSNFVAAIEGREPLDYSCREGELSLQLANAMLLSSWKNADVSLPIDGAEYKRELDEKIASSVLRENPKTDFIVDFKKSFR